MNNICHNLNLVFNPKLASEERGEAFFLVVEEYIKELEKLASRYKHDEVFPLEYIKPENKDQRFLSLHKIVKLSFKRAFSKHIYGYELERFLKHYFLTVHGCFYELARWYFFIRDMAGTIGSYRFGQIYYKDHPQFYENLVKESEVGND